MYRESDLIHPSAIIDNSARLGGKVKVGPFTVIGPGVEIGEGCEIGSHALISCNTRLGRNNRIYSFATVGEDPQDKKFAGEETFLEIGDNNTIREYASIHRGTADDRGMTRIGSDNLLMAYTHIAHDCVIGDHTILANGASLAGHVQIQDWAILGGFTLVHQFTRIGAHSFTGMGATIAKDVPPYLLVNGQPAAPHGINSEGLRRRGFGAERIQVIKQAYRLLYRQDLALEQALQLIGELAEEHDDLHPFADFIAARGSRPIIR